MRTRKKKTPGSESRPQLYPYQRRWVKDGSRFKIACKARQIGFTFAAAWRVVYKRIGEPGLTVWLSASERQALEAMEHIRRFCRELKVAAIYEESFFEGTLVKQHQVRFASGGRIVALPANPDTVRGFAGDVVLDEFAFHRDAEAIWRAAFATATRGFQIEIISTPNGARGKYYELARQAGLVDWETRESEEAREAHHRGAEDTEETGRGKDSEGRLCGRPAASSSQGLRPAPLNGHPERSEGSAFPHGHPSASGLRMTTPERKSGELEPAATRPLDSARGKPLLPERGASVWSPHWVDLATARAQGFVVDVESLRAAIGDEEAWQQEYCCRFLAEAAHYIPPELVVAAEHPAATTALPLTSHELPVTSHCFLGVDIGRRRDLTVLWLLEVENELAPPDARSYLTRAVVVLDRQPFAAQRRALDALLALRRETENRNSKIENRLSPTSFEFRISSFVVQRCAIDATGLGAMLAEELQARWGQRVEPVTFTLAVKEDLAVRVKRLLEERRLKLPYDPAVRAALNAVKRYVTPAGNVRFDAERTERAAHADHFWALALALLAAEEPGLSVDFVSTALPRPSSHAAAY